jgi:hypothetical protein
MGSDCIITRDENKLKEKLIMSGKTTKTYFNPGCAPMLYKPEAEKKIFALVRKAYADVQPHKICCKNEPVFEENALVISVCPGCNRRFGGVSVWEVIDSLKSFNFPDYDGIIMSVQDGCPVRNKPQVHAAVRSLLRKMNINIVEAERHGASSVCCGDDSFPSLPVSEVHAKMKSRADSMPCADVAVYCVSCIKSMSYGGKNPRYLMDLLFDEPTVTGEHDIIKWRGELQEYIDTEGKNVC